MLEWSFTLSPQRDSGPLLWEHDLGEEYSQEVRLLCECVHVLCTVGCRMMALLLLVMGRRPTSRLL